jgi:hypothetical protein
LPQSMRSHLPEPSDVIASALPCTVLRTVIFVV